MKLRIALFVGLLSAEAHYEHGGVAAFSASPLSASRIATVHPPPVGKTPFVVRPHSLLSMTEETTTSTEAAAPITSVSSRNDEMRIPLSFEEMVNQVSTAMEDAYKQGKTRQILRVLLPRSAANDQLLQYYEDDAMDGMIETVLAPTDETWQGGIMQLYRAASYTTQSLLRYVRVDGMKQHKVFAKYFAEMFELKSCVCINNCVDDFPGLKSVFAKCRWWRRS